MDDGIDLRQPDLREHPQTFATYGLPTPRDENTVACLISAVQVKLNELSMATRFGSEGDVDCAMGQLDLVVEDLRFGLIRCQPF